MIRVGTSKRRGASMNPNDGLMTPPELAGYLKIKIGSLYNLVSQRRIPHCHVGRLLRFRREMIDQWLSEASVEEERFDEG